MNKKMVIGIIAALILIGGVSYYAMNRDQENIESSDNSGDAMENKEDSSLFGSIKDAMNKGMSLRCEYSDEQNQTVVAYIKGNSVRTTIENPKSNESPSNFLMLDSTMYMWPVAGSNQGYMIKVDPETAQKAQDQTKGAENVDKATDTDIVGSLENYKQNCKSSVVADSMFEKPSNITFQDFSQLFKQ